jgi:two-component system chemotaxis response regulator CheB
VAGVYGAGALGVVLTGMGSDGMLGAKTIREQGGSVIAQDQASSTVWGMPGAVSNAGLANKVLDLRAIAPELVRLACRAASEARELRESAVS